MFVAIAIPETEHQVLEKSQFFSTRGPEANHTSKKQRTLKRTTTYVTNYIIYCSQRMGSIKVTITNGHPGNFRRGLLQVVQQLQQRIEYTSRRTPNTV